MSRGLFSGVLWGSAVAVVALWLASQLGGMVALLSTPPQDVAVTAPQENTLSNDTDTTAPLAPQTGSSPATEPSRQGSSLSGSNPDGLPQADTSPAQVPESTLLDNTPQEPTQGEAPAVISAAQNQTDTPHTSTELEQPAEETAPQVVTDSPMPKPVEPVSENPGAPLSETASDAVTPPLDAAPVVVGEPAQPQAPGADAPPTSDFSEPKVVATPIPVEPEPEPEAPDTTQAAKPETASGTEIGANAAVVRTNLLPRIGDASRADAAATPDETQLDLANSPAISRFAQPFENPRNQPIMSILLLVDPDAPNLSYLADPLPFPVSYVVDASQDNATQIMNTIRAAGHEVILQAPLPPRATPKDVEVAFQTYLTAVPEAVAVMDIASGEFQSGRSVATQVAQALAATGHGMITYSRGLNSATQVAKRENVPVALVFREFDKGGQDISTMKRFLDQAAFRAGQQPGVILVGRNRPATLTALLEWGLGNRASTVALAPASAALLAK